MEACKTTLRQLLIHNNAWTRTVTEVWVQTLPDYGCYVWPSAMVLVLWLSRRQGDLLPGITDEKVFASPRILELGRRLQRMDMIIQFNMVFYFFFCPSYRRSLDIKQQERS